MFLGHGILDIELGLTHIWLENKLRGAVSGITSTTYKLKTAKPAMIKKNVSHVPVSSKSLRWDACANSATCPSIADHGKSSRRLILDPSVPSKSNGPNIAASRPQAKQSPQPKVLASMRRC